MTKYGELLAFYGIDADAVMPRFCGDESFYFTCLKLFVKDDNFQKLERALEADDLDNAFFAAHTLKGMAANMGFDGVYDAVCAMVEPLRIKDPSPDYVSLLNELSTQMQKINELKLKADDLK